MQIYTYIGAFCLHLVSSYIISTTQWLKRNASKYYIFESLCPNNYSTQKVESVENFPGFIWFAVIFVSSGDKGIYQILVSFAAVSALIPDAASSSNNLAKGSLNYRNKALEKGIGAFKNCKNVIGSMNLVSSRLQTHAVWAY